MEERRKMRKERAVLLCLLLFVLLLTGCGKAGEGFGNMLPDNVSTGEGAFVEEDVTPEGVDFIFEAPVAMKDGSIVFYGKEGGWNGTLKRYLSKDGGKTFESSPVAWEADTNGTVHNLTQRLDGSCFFSSAQMENEKLLKLSYWYKPAEGDDITEIKALEGTEIQDFYLMDENTVYLHTQIADSGQTRGVIFDLKTQKEIREVKDIAEEYSGFIKGLAGYEGDGTSQVYYLSFNEEGELILGRFDRDGNVEKNLVKLETECDSGDCDQDGNYYYTSNGTICRIVKEGSIREQIMDDDGFELGLESNWCKDLCYVSDRCFICVISDQDFSNTRLMKYEWEQNKEKEHAAKDKKLKIWSLEKNNTVKAAIAASKKELKGVDVVYEIGIEEGEEKQKEDAIKELYASLTAKDAPDIIILDDMDYESFVNKGLLADIRDVAELKNMMPNIAQGFTNEDGSVYAIPARFCVPILACEQGELDDINGLPDLAKKVKQMAERPNYDCTQDAYYAAYDKEERYALGFCDYRQLMEFVMQTGGQALLDGNQVNEEKLRDTLSFLSAVGAKYHMNAYPETGMCNGIAGSGDGLEVFEMMDGFYEYGVTGHAQYGWEMLATPALFAQGKRTGMGKDTKVDFKIRSGLTQRPFVPTGIAGVRKGSENEELAKQFISVMLGEKVQDVNQQDGCSVRVSSMEKRVDKHKAYVQERGYSGDMMAFLKEVDEPVLPSQSLEYLENYILNHVKSMVAGEEDLDTAIEGVKEDMQLRLSEQE